MKVFKKQNSLSIAHNEVLDVGLDIFAWLYLPEMCYLVCFVFSAIVVKNS